MTARAPFYEFTRGGGRWMRRTREGIMMDILKVAVEPVGPTRIMYQTNLSWKPLRGYLGKLTAAGLIQLISTGKREVWETTEKGRNLLRLGENVYKQFQQTNTI